MGIDVLKHKSFFSMFYLRVFVTLLALKHAYGGVPDLHRRQEVKVKEDSEVDSDDFLANFLENIPEIPDERDIKLSSTTVSDPVPVHKEVSDGLEVSRDIDAIEARRFITTGVGAIAAVVSSAVGKFISFLAKKKLMLAAIGAAVLATFGIIGINQVLPQ